MFVRYLAKTKKLGLLAALAALMTLALAAGCGEPEPKVNPLVRELITVIIDQGKQVTDAVKNPLTKDDMEQVKSLLTDLKLGHPEAIKGDYGLAVLDEKGIFVGGRYFISPSENEQDKPNKVAGKLNLGNFTAVSQALKTGKHQKTVLYLPPDSPWGEKIYAVMSPVGSESHPAGVVVHFLRDTTLNAYNLNDETFLALSFD